MTTALALTLVIGLAAVCLIIRERLQAWSVLWSMTALWLVLELWTAQNWQEAAVAWRNAYWRDTESLQRQFQQLAPTPKERQSNDQVPLNARVACRYALTLDAVQSLSLISLCEHRSFLARPFRIASSVGYVADRNNLLIREESDHAVSLALLEILPHGIYPGVFGVPPQIDVISVQPY